MCRKGRRGGLAVSAVLAVFAIGVLAAGPAGPGEVRASVDERENVRAASSADLAPRALPRQGVAPVGIRLGADFATLDGSHLPRLEAMRFAISRGGRLDHRGIPRCRKSQLVSTTIESALAACRSALVGRGIALIRVQLPTQQPFPLRSTAYFFNSPGVQGRPRILLYMSSHQPFSPFILDVSVRRTPGLYGTVLGTAVPAGSVGVYVERFRFAFRRNVLRAGTRHSFLSAGCPAPIGLPGLAFPFVRTTYRFEGGLRLMTDDIQTCRVRDR